MKTNYEHYKESIERACKAFKTTPTCFTYKNIMNENCGGMYCLDCELQTLEWLNQPYQEPRKAIQMTLFERSVLECAGAYGYKYIVRDYIDDMICIHEYIPKKEDEQWDSCGNQNVLELFNDKFQFIQWEDKEPYDIQWLLDNCEVKEYE